MKTIEGMIAQVEGKAPATPATSDDPLKPLLGTWQHSEDSSIWKFDNINYLTFTADLEVMNGTYEENGRTKRFKLTRLK